MIGTLKAVIGVACILFYADLTAAANWYKGATHVHNSDTDSDASTSLIQMVQMYRDILSYNFLFSTPHHPGLVTELNNGTNASLLTVKGRFDTATFKAWDGEEVTTDIFRNGAWAGRHFGALGKTRIDPVLNSTSKRISGFNTIQDIIDHINAYPDPLLPIINHPSWGGLGAAEILADAEGANHLEVLNDYVSQGEQDIKVWDAVLSSGRQIYPIGADDAHSTNYAGQAWTVVWANDLSMNSVLDAMDQGKLYASTGPAVTFYSVNTAKMVVEAVKGTVQPPCCLGRRHTDPITEIRFVGKNGTILKTVPITSDIARAEYAMQGTELYIRAEVRTGQIANKRGLPELALLPAYFPAQSPPLTLGAGGVDDDAPPAGSATFVGVDSTTQGNWPGVYGADGYHLINHAVQYPSYVQVTPAGQLAYTWAASTTNPRALRKVNASDRIAATWYSGSTFTIDVKFTDGQPHQLALYLVDWDSTSRGQLVEVLDAVSGAVLDSRSVTGFNAGRYLVWDLRGHVRFRLTRTSGTNAVVSGLFFDP